MIQRNVLPLFLLLLGSLHGCSGGVVGTGDGNGGGNTDNNLGLAGSGHGGTIHLASTDSPKVAVFNYRDRSTTVCETVALAVGASADTWHFELPEECIVATDSYVVEVTGQSVPPLIDPDNASGSDGFATELATPARLRSTMTGQQIMDLNWHISELTETLTLGLEYVAQQGLAESDLVATGDAFATQILNQDINADSQVNMADILEWTPAEQAALANPEAVTELVGQSPAGSQQPDGADETGEGQELVAAETLQFNTRSPARRVASDEGLTAVVTSVSAQKDEVLVLNSRSITVPRFMATIRVDKVTDLTLLNNRLFLALGPNGLREYDLSNPEQPMFMGQINSKIDKIAAIDTRLFTLSVTARHTVFSEYDISAPGLLRLGAEQQLPGATFGSDVVVNDSFVAFSITHWGLPESRLYRFGLNRESWSDAAILISDQVTFADLAFNDAQLIVAQVYPTLFASGQNDCDGSPSQSTDCPGIVSVKVDGSDVTRTSLQADTQTATVATNDTQLIYYQPGALISVALDSSVTGDDRISYTLPGEYSSLLGPEVDMVPVDGYVYVANRDWGLIIVNAAGQQE